MSIILAELGQKISAVSGDDDRWQQSSFFNRFLF